MCVARTSRQLALKLRLLVLIDLVDAMMIVLRSRVVKTFGLRHKRIKELSILKPKKGPVTGTRPR